MPARSNQKLKLLYLYRMLREETDAAHGLSTAQIIERLAEKGIDAERKSIYRDLDILREFGCSITATGRAPTRYAMNRDGLSFNELTMLVDAVQGSKFLTQRTSDRLASRLGELASVHERAQLVKRVHVDGRVKSQSESVFHNVDVIHEAMRLKRKITFLYFKYDNRMERQIQHGGKPYVHTPVQVVLSEGFYYLVTWSDAHEDFVRFRIDRMRLVQISPAKGSRNPQIANYTFQDFASQSFGMFDGRSVSAKLHVQPGAMDIVADRFGTDITPTAHEDGSAEVVVNVRTSAQFFGWIASMDKAITIMGPKSLVEEYRTWLESLLEE